MGEMSPTKYFQTPIFKMLSPWPEFFFLFSFSLTVGGKNVLLSKKHLIKCDYF